MSQHFRFSFLSMAVLGVVMAGCKSIGTDTGGFAGATLQVTRPGVGSVFLLHDQAFDSLGKPVALYDEWDTVVVVSSGISYQGKSNVVAVKDDSFRPSTNGTSIDVTYLNYEPNGDISVLKGSTGSVWVTIPMASEGTTSSALEDTTYTDSAGRVQHKVLTDQYAYLGRDTVNEAGASFDTRSFLFNQYMNGEASPYPETEWWAPSVGFLVKTVSVYAEAVWGGAVRFTDDLVSYTLK